MSLAQLPSPVLIHQVLPYLSPSMILRLGCTCTLFRELANKDETVSSIAKKQLRIYEDNAIPEVIKIIERRFICTSWSGMSKSTNKQLLLWLSKSVQNINEEFISYEVLEIGKVWEKSHNVVYLRNYFTLLNLIFSLEKPKTRQITLLACFIQKFFTFFFLDIGTDHKVEFVKSLRVFKQEEALHYSNLFTVILKFEDKIGDILDFNSIVTQNVAKAVAAAYYDSKKLPFEAIALSNKEYRHYLREEQDSINRGFPNIHSEAFILQTKPLQPIKESRVTFLREKLSELRRKNLLEDFIVRKFLNDLDHVKRHSRLFFYKIEKNLVIAISSILDFFIFNPLIKEYQSFEGHKSLIGYLTKARKEVSKLKKEINYVGVSNKVKANQLKLCQDFSVENVLKMAWESKNPEMAALISNELVSLKSLDQDELGLLKEFALKYPKDPLTARLNRTIQEAELRLQPFQTVWQQGKKLLGLLENSYSIQKE
jgi:hypothetical protein